MGSTVLFSAHRTVLLPFIQHDFCSTTSKIHVKTAEGREG